MLDNAKVRPSCSKNKRRSVTEGRVLPLKAFPPAAVCFAFTSLASSVHAWSRSRQGPSCSPVSHCLALETTAACSFALCFTPCLWKSTRGVQSRAGRRESVLPPPAPAAGQIFPCWYLGRPYVHTFAGCRPALKLGFKLWTAGSTLKVLCSEQKAHRWKGRIAQLN